MKEYIKSLQIDKSLVIPIEESLATSHKESVTVILENRTKLNEVFTKLPRGIINKTETGIGATTLELESKRNSIIVEPLKVTASSKAKEISALYVGSPTLIHKKPAKSEDIIGYLNDSAVENKKIVVVADSFPKVADLIKETKAGEFFLLLDDIDAFQEDSTFRSRMEFCMDYYKEWNSENRAITTATMLPFSDPDIINEPMVVFKYKIPTEKSVELISTNNVEETCMVRVRGVLAEKKDKVVVAYNSVKGSKRMADTLIKEGVLENDDIGILCGENHANKKTCGSLFAELSDSKLNNRVSFMTSAYFSGFDIKERFHLISISSGADPVLMLSTNNHKQISGRSRDDKGVLSNIFVYETRESLERYFTSLELINAGKAQLKAMECFSSNYEKDPFLLELMKSIREKMEKGFGNEFTKFVRTNHKGGFEVSYFNIDAFFEEQKTKIMHSSNTKILKAFEDIGYKVTQRFEPCAVEKNPHDFKKEREMFMKEIAILSDQVMEYDSLYASSNLNINSSHLEKRIHALYVKIASVITRTSFAEVLKEKVTDMKSLGRFEKAAEGFALLSRRKSTAALLHEYFPIDKDNRFKKEVFKERWLEFVDESAIVKYPHGSDVDVSKLTHKKLMEDASVWLDLKTSQSCKNKTSERDCMYVKSHNPYGFKEKKVGVFSLGDY